MKVTEPAREIDVIHQTDVLVVGSGPGGLAAALAAARAGVNFGGAIRLLRWKPDRGRRGRPGLVPPRKNGGGR